jgi:hypothetical protein
MGYYFAKLDYYYLTLVATLHSSFVILWSRSEPPLEAGAKIRGKE